MITKTRNEEMEKEICSSMTRGVTRWDAVGAFTDEQVQVLFVLVSKYELGQLKSIVHKHDPHAFVMINEGVRVVGNYLTKI